MEWPNVYTLVTFIQVLIGNREWMTVNGVQLLESVEGGVCEYEEQGKTVVLVAVDGKQIILSPWDNNYRGV